MKTPAFFRPTVGIAGALLSCAVAATLAACSSTASQQPSPLSAMAPPQLAHFSHHRPSVSVIPFAVHPNRHKSWFSPDLKRDAKGDARILFISDAASDTVTLLTLPDLTMKAQITGFTSPYGTCPDGTGGVWVTDADTGNLYHESRSGQQIGAPLSDPAPLRTVARSTKQRAIWP